MEALDISRDAYFFIDISRISKTKIKTFIIQLHFVEYK